jgi:hypothetical protein
MKLKFLFAMVLAAAPALVFASQAPQAHIRPQLYHDRTPKAHVHQSLPHRSA